MRSRRAIVTLTATLLLGVPPAAWAGERFASPGGSGEACTKAVPCGIVAAIDKAAANDDVTVEPGTYETSEGLRDEKRTLTIHGLAGSPRPVVIAHSGGLVLEGASSTVRDIEFDVPGAHQSGLFVAGFGESAERVLVHTLGSETNTCVALQAFTMNDSVCVADGTNSYALLYNASIAGVATLRNDTLEASGGSGPLGSVGVKVKAFGGSELQVTLINSIAHGSNVDLLAAADSNAKSDGVLAAEHSNFATENVESEGGKTSVTPHGTGTNQTAAPLFANPGMDDFHELTGSPTIGAGFSSPANGLTDLHGIARQFGGLTDIGAYQFVGPPSCQAISTATGFGTPVSMQLQCSDPLGAPIASYAIVAGPGHGSVTLGPATGAVTYTPAAGFSGADTFTFDAVGSHGTSAPAAATITVGAAPAPPAALVAPSDSQPVLAPTTFAALTSGASVARAVRGTTVTYSDTQAATTTFTVRHQLGRGVLSHGKCLAPPHRKAVHGKRCTRVSTVGSFAHVDVAGANRFRFTGRVRGRALAPGSYQLVSAPTNAAGKTGASHVNAFKIVAR